MSYKSENLRPITANGKKNLYFYFNDDASTVTASGFFNDVRLNIGDVVIVYDGTNLTDYKISSASGNSKTGIKIRDVASIKNDVTKLKTKVPDPPTTDGSYLLNVVVSGDIVMYGWKEEGDEPK